MAEHLTTPHFHNQPGVPIIHIGVREFMCTGALPPFDHPHTYIDMGGSDDAVCPYCSTRFVLDVRLGTGCQPPECEFHQDPDS